MTAKDYIELKQKEWAKRYTYIDKENIEDKKNIEKKLSLTNDDRYTKTYNENLFEPLDEKIENLFKNADGGELNGEECKMAAVYSSSAICVNVFQYFYLLQKEGKKEEAKKILYALEVAEDPKIEIKDENILFEQKLHISDISTPNIDVIIKTTNNKVFAIESKFREPYYYTPSNYIQEKYYKTNEIWNKLKNIKKNIDELEEGYIEIEKDIMDQKTDIEKKEICVKKIFPHFKRLNAAQLIKHLLGLFNDNQNNDKIIKDNIRLVYLYYDVPGNIGEEHRKEIKEFSEVIKKDNIKFTPISYQELIFNLNNLLTDDNHKEYLNYINSRYL